MYIHYGGDAFTNFQIKKTNVKINSAKFFYIAHFKKPLDDKEQEKLADILGVQSTKNPNDNLWVIPRIGTISPWSSKATEILKQCGLIKTNRIERGIAFEVASNLTDAKTKLHDKMTQSVIFSLDDLTDVFKHTSPTPLTEIDVLTDKNNIHAANTNLGLALNINEIEYLVTEFTKLNRNPTDVELMMFAQANSEHCRHKIFNAKWKIDGKDMPNSLFGMIKQTYQNYSTDVLSAYSDNACVVSGYEGERFFPDENDQYQTTTETINLVFKAETHNHPTAISPFAGATTGAGGEIRDGGATGRGAKPKAGFAGFSVSNLKLKTLPQPWEVDFGKPERIASPQEIMLDAPIGAATFNNEFGRPVLGGYFRTLEILHQNQIRGYHKPIMLSAGISNIREQHIQKNQIPNNAKIVVLGGPAMLIGLGGGGASSLKSGKSLETLDFASVQRGNPEIERRVQEVIDKCWQLGKKNPIISIHDVGAGGLSNAVPEIVHDCNMGGKFELREINNAEPSMSPLAIWCNEAQERYVVAVENTEMLFAICNREMCPYSLIGVATLNQDLTVSDKYFANEPIDLPMSLLFGNTPKTQIEVITNTQINPAFDTRKIELKTSIKLVLSLPSVASKSFLITIADRSITGMVARDQMVGAWQTPVADVAVTALDFTSFVGEATAMGEKPLISLLNGAASGRMAVAEAITNLAAAHIKSIDNIKLSANWMAASGTEGEDAVLYQAVQAVSEICQNLNICIPVGKDSMSMQTSWNDNSVISPVSLIISSFAPVLDIRKTLTPEINSSGILLLISLNNQARLGGSAIAQVYGQTSDTPPDIDDVNQLKYLFNAVQELNHKNLIKAYHDRSDGGILITLLEMAFTAHCGLDIHLDNEDVIATLFNEEIGVVIQVEENDLSNVLTIIENNHLLKNTIEIAKPTKQQVINIYQNDHKIFSDSRVNLQKIWSRTSFEMQKLRDNPECAEQEFNQIDDENNPGISPKITFDINNLPSLKLTPKPKVAILREQGVNGQIEMAAAFYQAGFDCVDVHMSDLFNDKYNLTQFDGLVACGGFSYGDVLGAGLGWAKSILHNPKLKDQFSNFFNHPNSFTLGVCNGCQMLAALKELIPGAEDFPNFIHNHSTQFEGRVSSVEILPSPSIFFSEMTGSIMPIAIAHSEGKVNFADKQQFASCLKTLRFVDNYGDVAVNYPTNPNGSTDGLTGFTSVDGRVTIMMPHPERVFRTVTNSWYPKGWNEKSPWFKMFVNAKKKLG